MALSTRRGLAIGAASRLPCLSDNPLFIDGGQSAAMHPADAQILPAPVPLGPALSGLAALGSPPPGLALPGHATSGPDLPGLAPAAAELLPGQDAFDHSLRGALLESRQRWRDFTTLAADLVFETDAAGRLAFLAPDSVLGWDAASLLGQPARRLLLRPNPDPFTLRAPAQRVKVWLRRGGGPEGNPKDGQTGGQPAAGPASCFCFNVVPLADAAGHFAGLRGCGRDVTAEMAEATVQAAALRRAGALESLVRRVRQEVLAPRMLAAALESLPAVLGCTGAAVLEMAAGATPLVLQRHGEDPTPLLPMIHALQPPLAETGDPRFLSGPRLERLALLPQPHRGATRHALLAWRAAGSRPFDADDRHLLLALADLLFVTLGNQVLQQELELQARTESLTGLLNRRAFLADLRRRLDRLDHGDHQAPSGAGGGALLFIDLDNFKPINDLLGHQAGDAALIAVAGLLREIIRPTDLAARLGGDEFALWLHDSDADAAAGRAMAICQAAAEVLPPLLRSGATALTFSIGCAVRAIPETAGGSPEHPPRKTASGETAELLLARADAAMYVAKRAGRNGWSIAQSGAPSGAPSGAAPAPSAGAHTRAAVLARA